MKKNKRYIVTGSMGKNHGPCYTYAVIADSKEDAARKFRKRYAGANVFEVKEEKLGE